MSPAAAKLLRLAAALLVVPAAAAPAEPEARDASAPEARFFFIQLSDPQLGFFEENRGFARESENLARAVEHVNRLRPAFVVVTGDLVHRPLDEPQAREYLRLVRSIDASIPLHSVAGNHDVGNVPTMESLAWFRERFGKDRDAFAHEGSWFLHLNSSLFHSPEKCPEEAALQMEWLREALRRARQARTRHIVLFQHHPWFVVRPDEPDDYHSIPRARRGECLKLLEEAGVRATFAGHLHRCAHPQTPGMEMVVTGPVGKPLGKDPSGLRVVWVFDDRLEHRYYGLDQVPRQVPLRGPRDRRRL